MKNGFTLIELSIVLVIIGLVIGGVTVGQELIRSAELNSIITDVNRYTLAIKTFELKYDELPGDIDNAQSYWPTCIDNGPNTCNGNSNGRVVEAFENNRSWQHLSLSGIIAENYTGRQIGGTANKETFPHLLDQMLLNYEYKDITNLSDWSGSNTLTGEGHFFIWNYREQIFCLHLNGTL
jgi:prepilin-type N-terminal cleavage/methylation domain-containing protein